MYHEAGTVSAVGEQQVCTINHAIISFYLNVAQCAGAGVGVYILPWLLVPLVRCCVVLTCCYRVHCVQLYIWHWHYKWQLVCWGVEGRKMLLWNIDVSFVGLWWCLRKFMFTITWVINAKQSVNSIQQQVSFRFWWSNKAIRRTRYWGWDLKSCTQSFMKW